MPYESATPAGSTWPADEEVLLPALEELRNRGVLLGAAVAPHEVDEPRLAQLERRLDRHGFTAARWSRIAAAEASAVMGVTDGSPPRPPVETSDGLESDSEPRSSEGDTVQRGERLARFGGALGFRAEETVEAAVVDAVVIDRIGLLHRLYGRASVAWVGGAFAGRVHNVMEPLAHGVPVVTGPRTGRSWVARDLTRACALFPVADREACVAALGHLLRERDAARAAGMRGLEALRRHAGAARRTVAALEESCWPPQALAGEAESFR